MRAGRTKVAIRARRRPRSAPAVHVRRSGLVLRAALAALIDRKAVAGGILGLGFSGGYRGAGAEAVGVRGIAAVSASPTLCSCTATPADRALSRFVQNKAHTPGIG